MAIAPIYFASHDEPEVACFFKKGSQQYIYAEDLLNMLLRREYSCRHRSYSTVLKRTFRIKG